MTRQPETNWISRNPDALPDFIIGGAMKSGTTTLHALLNTHPDIAIAQNELGFFDIDGILQHPDFSFFDPKQQKWLSQTFDTDPELFWNWYYSQFKALKKEGVVVGEDSTTYLTSRIAAQRISKQQKPIKLIFVLRHPSKRTVSNYLHNLKSGRAIYNLEDTLNYDPNSIIRRSMYYEQLEVYYRFLPFESIKVILFEDLIDDPKKCMSDVCTFLGVDFNRMDESALGVHSNKTKIPKYIPLQLLRNRWMQKTRAYRYSSLLPLSPKFQEKLPLKYRILDGIHKRINPKRTDYNFQPHPETLSYLDSFFKVELDGIDELTQQPIFSKWFDD